MSDDDDRRRARTATSRRRSVEATARPSTGRRRPRRAGPVRWRSAGVPGRAVEGLRRRRCAGCSGGWRPSDRGSIARRGRWRVTSATLDVLGPEAARPRHRHHRQRGRRSRQRHRLRRAAPRARVGGRRSTSASARAAVSAVVHARRRRPAHDVPAARRRRGQDQPPAARATSTSQPRGDLLSRVTNDIDNVAQSLQQTLSQMLTSVLTLIGVRRSMMFTISPLLALVALDHGPAVAVRDAGRSPARSRPRFISQWTHTGALNAQIEETFTGHALVKAFGRQREVEERFRDTNDELYERRFGAQFMSGLDPAGDDVPRQPAATCSSPSSAACGWPAARSRIGDVQAFIQYSRQFSQPLTQLASMMNVLPVGHRLGRAGLRVPRRRRAVARPPTPATLAPAAGPGRVRATCSFSYDPDAAADRATCRSSPSPARPSPSSARPAPARPRSST